MIHYCRAKTNLLIKIWEDPREQGRAGESQGDLGRGLGLPGEPLWNLVKPLWSIMEPSWSLVQPLWNPVEPRGANVEPCGTTPMDMPIWLDLPGLVFSFVMIVLILHRILYFVMPQPRAWLWAR